MADSVELKKFTHSRHAAKRCPMVDVKKKKNASPYGSCILKSLNRSVRQEPEGVSDKSHKKRQKAKRYHDSDVKAESPAFRHRDARTEAL